MRKKLLKIGLFTISSIVFFDVLRKSIKNIVGIYENERDRYMCYYYTLREWIFNKQKGKSISDYFIKNNITTIAIYGKGTLGDLLYNDIKETNIKILYVIDKITDEKFHQIPVINLEQINEQARVDAIIITPICDYPEILQNIERYDSNTLKLSFEQLIL